MFNVGQMVPFLECLMQCCCGEIEKEESLLPNSFESGTTIEEMTPQISMPKLSFKYRKRLPAVLRESKTLEQQLGSQGFFVSPDGTYAYSHESNIPLTDFQERMGLSYAINMDRGGVVTRANGTHAACIADGVGGDGFFSAFVAQFISRCLLNALSQESSNFSENNEYNKQIVEQLFRGCAEGLHELNCNVFIGSSTALFVECIPAGRRNGKKIYSLHVGALGDSAAIYINNENKKAVQLNEIYRKYDPFGKPDISSTGGCISVNNRIFSSKNIVAKVCEVSEDDYIVLVTDGFLDNVRDNRVGEMVALLAYQPFFEQSFETLLSYDRFWEEFGVPELPTLENIKQFIRSNGGMAPDDNPTPAQITKRLANYTKLVTYTLSKLQEEEYKKNKIGIITAEHPPKTDDDMIITISPSSK